MRVDRHGPEPLWRLRYPLHRRRDMRVRRVRRWRGHEPARQSGRLRRHARYVRRSRGLLHGRLLLPSALHERGRRLCELRDRSGELRRARTRLRRRRLRRRQLRLELPRHDGHPRLQRCLRPNAQRPRQLRRLRHPLLGFAGLRQRWLPRRDRSGELHDMPVRGVCSRAVLSLDEPQRDGVRQRDHVLRVMRSV